MSAFLCDRCHLSALAGAVHVFSPELSIEAAHALLLAENWKSLHARYPRQYEIWNDQDSSICDACAAGKPTAVELCKAASCYAYQSCEHDGWADSDARRHIDRVLAWCANEIAHGLPAYQRAAWGYTPTHLLSDAEASE